MDWSVSKEPIVKIIKRGKTLRDLIKITITEMNEDVEMEDMTKKKENLTKTDVHEGKYAKKKPMLKEQVKGPMCNTKQQSDIRRFLKQLPSPAPAKKKSSDRES